ncbi:MAG TPA: chorismate synthase [Thermoplasmata archaeon]|nr:chorismate synthase [Thermoplasmata archaeon]
MRFGTALTVTVFGSSHGPEVGTVVTGLPAGVPIDLEETQRELDRRSPVGRALATRRQEADRLVVDEGIASGATTGGPIRAHVANQDVQRGPYDRLRDTPRPGHADFPARIRYGDSADLSGGGIFSGRMTVGLVVAGSLARQLLRPRGIDFVAFTRSVASIDADVPVAVPLDRIRSASAENEVGCPDAAAATRMAEAIAEARRSGDSVGGVIECRGTGLPVGLGEPFFDSVESEVAHLAFSIPAVKGLEFGSGFRAARMRGSEHNDPYRWADDRVVPQSNHAGGILGGLATGAPLVFRAAVKPTSSIARPQRTVDLRKKTDVEIVVTGRHDPCIVPRAVVVVESIAAIAVADLALRGGFLT